MATSNVHRLQELLLLLVVTELLDGGAVQGVVGAHDDTSGRTSAADLLHGDGVRHGVQIGTTPLTRHLDAHHTQFTQLANLLGREEVLSVNLGSNGHQLSLGEVAASLSNHDMLFLQQGPVQVGALGTGLGSHSSRTG